MMWLRSCTFCGVATGGTTSVPRAAVWKLASMNTMPAGMEGSRSHDGLSHWCTHKSSIESPLQSPRNGNLKVGAAERRKLSFKGTTSAYEFWRGTGPSTLILRQAQDEGFAFGLSLSVVSLK